MSDKSEGLRERKEIIPVVPTKFADVEDVVKRIKRKEGVIIDFDTVPPAIAQRMLDFLSGATFALRGSIKKIKYKTFILIPDGVKITSIKSGL